MIFPIYIVCGLLFWGLIEWGLHDAKVVGWVSFGVFMGYLLLILVCVYNGSSTKKAKERAYIREKIAERNVHKEEERLENEKYKRFLEKYKH